MAAACGNTETNPTTSGTAGTGGTGAGGSAGSSTGGNGMTTGSGAGTTSSTGTTTSTGGMTTGTGGGTGGAGNNGMPSDVYPAPHLAAPKVVWAGGKTLTSPKMVPIYFTNDDAALTAQITDFNTKLGATAYWLANVEEYGGSAAVGLPPVQLKEAAPGKIDDSAVQTWLEGKLNSDDPAFPKPDGNTIYAIYYPETTTITLQGSASCQTFGGYHQEVKLDANHGSQLVPYAVIPRCANFAGMSVLEATTSSASHEYIEATTDPFPNNDPAYAQVDDADIFWLFALGGGETGDMCAQQGSSFVQFPGLPYTVQRSWSNKSAAASHDPCVPAFPDGEVYFNAAPEVTKIPVPIQGQTINMNGVKIPVGGSKTISIDLFSDAKTNGPWTVDAKDLSALQGGKPELQFSFDKTSGVNGEKLNMTIKVLAKSQFNAEVYFLTSTLGQKQNLWVGLVAN